MFDEVAKTIKRLKSLIRSAEEDLGDVIEDCLVSPQEVLSLHYKVIYLKAELAYQRLRFEMECDTIWVRTEKDKQWIRELCPHHCFCWRCI